MADAHDSLFGSEDDFNLSASPRDLLYRYCLKHCFIEIMVKVKIIRACKTTCLRKFQNLCAHVFCKRSVSFAHFPVWTEVSWTVAVNVFANIGKVCLSSYGIQTEMCCLQCLSEKPIRSVWDRK